MENEVITKAVTGVTASIAYECTFADAGKKTITIGSYRTNDLPNSATIKNAVNTFNSNPDSDIATNLLNAQGSQLAKISGVTITVKNTNVLIG